MTVIMSRSAGPASEGAMLLTAGNLRVDVAMYRAFVADQPVELTYQEFELLRLLATNRDRIVSYNELVEAIWPGEKSVRHRRLGVAVCRLRARLAGSWPYRIQTVRGRGYGLTVGRS